ncbi:MAG TPA: nuclear transport factor 2 family protein [Acidimicrobiales bacterium]
MSASDDIEAIKQLKARYFRLMDTKDWDGLATVFADDVHIDMTGEGGVVTESVDEYMPFIRQVIGDVITVHQGHMPEITLTSPTTATGIWALEDRLWWPEGSPISSMHAFGHYHETYERFDGEWYIKTMTLTRLHRLVTTPA